MFCLLAIQDNRGGNVMHEIPTTIFSEKIAGGGQLSPVLVKQSKVMKLPIYYTLRVRAGVATLQLGNQAMHTWYV